MGALIGRIVGGLVLVIFGAIIVIKTEKIIEQVGRSSWAEAKFGFYGGTRFMWKMIGLIATFVGFLIMTNMFGGFFSETLGKLLVPKGTL